MKVCGIVAEYNPFHNGHLYQLNKIKDCAIEYSMETIENIQEEDNETAIKLLTESLLLELSSLLIKENRSREDLLKALSLTTEEFGLI